MRILIVDDSDIIRERLAERIAGIPGVTEVVHAVDGEEALSAIEEDALCIVILDVHMPNVTGFEVLKALGARESAPSVIVLTENLAYHHHALRLGAAYCFDKASETEHVYSAIQGLLARQPGSFAS